MARQKLPITKQGKSKEKKLVFDDGKLDNDPRSGFDNTAIREMVPRYNQAGCEKVYSGDNNNWIILGRDRPAGIESGFGGRGHTRAGAIDLVVGIQGWAPGENYKPAKINARTGETEREEQFGYADKNFGSMNNGQPGDAARIYISQRTDLDKYFDICDSYVRRDPAGSAIGIKADSIRIMARKGIKIVTGKNPPGRNSLDGKLDIVEGIDLIAGNRAFNSGLEQRLQRLVDPLGLGFYPPYLQPIPKGENLIYFLKNVSQNMQHLNSITAGFLMIMPLLINATLSPKLGVSPTGPVTTFPGITDITNVTSYTSLMSKQMSQLIFAQKKTLRKELECLEKGGKHYVNSLHNRTN